MCQLGFDQDVFLGNEKAAIDETFLRAAGIRMVLNCANGVVLKDREGISVLHLNLGDSESNTLYACLYPALEFLLKARHWGERVLVHCKAGVSRFILILFFFNLVLIYICARSVSMCVAYLMFREGMHFEDAYEKVRNWRGSIFQIRDSFKVDLRVLERALFKPKASRSTTDSGLNSMIGIVTQVMYNIPFPIILI